MYTYVIIDDESLIRKGTIKKLSDLADRVSCVGEAQNGQEGAALIEERRPDFVILDMQMPVMDGSRLLPLLAERFPHMPLIVISGYRDFDYIKHAISANAVDYILKPFGREAIQDCVLRTIQRIDSSQTIQKQLLDSREEKEAAYYEYDIQNLTNLVLGYHTGNTEIASEKLKFINHTHQLVLITLLFSSLPAATQLQDWLEEGGFGDLALYLSNQAMPQMGFLVLFIPQHSSLSLSSITTQITDALTTQLHQLGIRVQFGISRPHKDLGKLHDAYEETAAALNGQLLVQTGSPIYSYCGEPSRTPLSWDREEEFLFRVEAGMEEEVRDLMDLLFHHLLSIPGATLADAKLYCYSLSGRCRDILGYYLKQDSVRASDSIQNIVSQIFSLRELKAYYLQFFLNITGLLKHESIYALDDVVEKIKIYIQHNYHKNLTQDFLASLFYLNRSYLSTLFRQRTHMKFIDYLNEVRIARSKELLRDSGRKMYQISRAVGYDNTKYFFRIFKKKAGMTPEQYRKEQPPL